MNPIELEWQHLKKDELSGQIFDALPRPLWTVLKLGEIKETTVLNV
jgi:hypothetical protein